MQYAMVIDQLDDESGGGFIAFCPDLPGCISDGETAEEALANLKDAMACWIEVQLERGIELPDSGWARDDNNEALTKLAEECEALRKDLETARDRIRQLERGQSIWSRTFRGGAPARSAKYAHA